MFQSEGRSGMKRKMGRVSKKMLIGLLAVLVLIGINMVSSQAATEGYLSYTVKNGVVTITDCDTSASGELVIPETIAGYPVTSIDSSAFQDCIGLTSISIPESVTSIGKYAFAWCESLKEIRLPAGITSIEESMFHGCVELVGVYIPEGVTSIGKKAFRGCYYLTNVNIPSSVTRIDDYAFDFCMSLAELNIPTGVTELGDYVFMGCSRLVVGINSLYVKNYVEEYAKEYRIEYVLNLERLSVKEMPVQTEYCPNEDFDPTGLTLTATYPDGSSEEISTGYEVSGFDSSKAGECTVKAQYANCETAFQVIVLSSHSYDNDTDNVCNVCEYERTVTSVVIKTVPNKVTYCLGETINTEGLVLFATYNDGTTFEQSSDYEINGFNSNIAGKCTVRVKYRGCTTTFGVSIRATHSYDNDTDDNCNVCEHARTIISVEIKEMPNKIQYYINEEFDDSGLVLKVNYDDGTSKEETDGFEISGFNSTKPGVCTIIIYKNGFTTGFDVRILANKLDAVNRIYGSTRYKTAFKTADALKEQLGIEKFDVIIVANGNNFADALSGSYLAGVKNAPILMMDGTNITAVCDYINSNLNAGGTVYLLGGKSVLPETLESALSNYNVKRLWGNTRYGTNLAILKEAGVGKADILVCTGNGFADSLSASAAKRPILLVGSSLTKAQKEFLDNLSGNKFYIIGGVNAVSTGIEAEIQAYGNTERIGGASRFRTSVMIAEKFFENPQSAVIAYAYNFPDGLSGGPLAMSMDAPLILSAGGSEGAASAYMKKCDITSGAVLGGPGILSDSTVQKIFNLESESAIKVW